LTNYLQNITEVIDLLWKMISLCSLAAPYQHQHMPDRAYDYKIQVQVRQAEKQPQLLT